MKKQMTLLALTLALAGCGGESAQQAAQTPAPQAEKPVEKPQVSTPASKAEANAQQEEDVHAVQGAVTAAKVPQQPKPPADLGASVYGQCVGCHGPQGGGGVGPKLAGQSADALKQKLFDYKAGKQLGPQTAMMAPIAQSLTDAQVEAVANYIATHFK